MTTKDILIQALALMDGGKRWASLPHLDGEHDCVYTAIRSASGGFREEFSPHMLKAIEVFAGVNSIPQPTIGRVMVSPWNDAPERTWQEVECAFKSAIASLP